MPRSLTLLAVLALAGGAHAPPCVPEVVTVTKVERLPIPAECLAACPVAEGGVTTNGDLLEAYSAAKARAACLEARMMCVRALQP